MMRSLFSGVSGLKNHQTRMDVIGDNIANVNTTGFKGSRATFQDILSQTITGASSPQGNLGGTNAKQIGLGVALAGIDVNMTDGSVQSTGYNTDLCLSGSGFFILGNGNNKYYTRDGSFRFDESGNFVNSGGLKVQGWMADETGTINTNAGVTDILVPVGQTMAAKASTEVKYSKNLSADASNGTTVTAGLTKKEVVKNLGLASGSDDYNNVNGMAVGTITLSDGITKVAFNGETYTTTVVITKDTTVTNLSKAEALELLEIKAGSTDADLVNALATSTKTVTLSNGAVIQYDASKTPAAYTLTASNLTKSSVLGITSGADSTAVNNLGSAAVTNGTKDTKITYDGTSYSAVSTETGLSDTAAKTDPNYSSVLGGADFSALTAAGDYMDYPSGNVTIRVTYNGGTNYTVTKTGTNLTEADAITYTSGSASDTTAVKNAAKVTLSTGATVELKGTNSYTMTEQPGLTQAKVMSTLSLKAGSADYKTVDALDTVTLNDGVNKVSYNGLDDYTVTRAADTAVKVVASVTAYDSQGVAHVVTGTFTKLKESNQWTFDPGKATDTGCTISGGTGTITFDENGKYLSSDVSPITFNPSDAGLGGAATTLTLDFSSMTQYEGDSAIAVDKDGNKAGSLQSVSLNESGVIVGVFSNGLRKDLGQVALATFNNPAGLTKSGTSLYSESNNSGDAQISSAGTGGAGKLTPSSLEMSNVNLSEQFSDMIITQRGFQSNSKIITVSDEMLETLVNLKR